MGMPISIEQRWSAEDVWALPDDPHTRYETVDGALLMSAAPRVPHQLISYLLAGEHMLYVDERWHPAEASEPQCVNFMALFQQVFGDT
jgi:hypothetical protein